MSARPAGGAGGAPPRVADAEIAHPDQIAGSRVARVVGGSGDGALLLTIWTPSLEVDLQIDRALDVLSVRCGGRRFGWVGPPGLTHHAMFEPAEFGWQRTFNGGLLTTCGLEHVGAPGSVDNDQLPPTPRVASYPAHGRIAHASAELIERSIDEGAGVLRVRAVARQGAIYDERLSMRRTVEVGLREPTLTISDLVRNDGSLPARHAILYHVNFGYPDARAGAGIRSGDDLYLAPELSADAAEVVERWDAVADEARAVELLDIDGSTVVRATQSATLNHLFLWSVPRSRTNALGFAPSSSAVDGSVHRLQPGEEITYDLAFEFSTSAPGDAKG